MRIAVDAMGGDFTPGIMIEAVQMALAEIPDLEVLLVGHTGKLPYYLERYGLAPSNRLELVHAESVVEMSEPSTTSIRAKKDSSITVCADLVKAGRAAAIVTVGHTGAAVAATKVRLRTLPGVDRPALATLMPSVGPIGKSIVIDVGANTECTPANLAQFALMGELYSQLFLKIEKPRIGLLSVGGEDASDIAIKSVTCYQSGNGRTVALGSTDSIELLLENAVFGFEEFLAALTLRNETLCAFFVRKCQDDDFVRVKIVLRHHVVMEFCDNLATNASAVTLVNNRGEPVARNYDDVVI